MPRPDWCCPSSGWSPIAHRVITIIRYQTSFHTRVTGIHERDEAPNRVGRHRSAAARALSQADSEGSIPFTRSTLSGHRVSELTCGNRRHSRHRPERRNHPLRPVCSPIAHIKMMDHAGTNAPAGHTRARHVWQATAGPRYPGRARWSVVGWGSGAGLALCGTIARTGRAPATWVAGGGRFQRFAARDRRSRASTRCRSLSGCRPCRPCPACCRAPVDALRINFT